MIPAYHQQDDRSNSSSGGQDKWIHRLRELERRLKAEREARLLDRSGARKRLEERDAVNEELRMELERERMRKERDAVNEGLQMELERERESMSMSMRKESELSMTGDVE